jgi:penicillin-binding protein 2
VDRRHVRAALVPAALIALGAVAVCQRDSSEREASVWEQVVPARRGTIRDRAGRVLAIDGDGGREYPFGSLAAHAIGYVAATGTDAIVGRSGAEAAWDGALRGTGAVLRVAVDDQGRQVGEAITITPATPGRDVTLTLDMELMEIVERAFEGYGEGAVVVVDVHDGSVRALFSAPSIDPGELSGVLSSDRIAELRESGALIDHTIERSHLPGGTVKTFTVLAGLEAGIDPEVPVTCTGAYSLGRGPAARCGGAHGETDARHAIATSCSVYTFSIADQIGLDGLVGIYRDFGFGSPTGLGLRGELSGFVLRSEADDLDATRRAVRIAAGQAEMDVTPMQLAMAYAAVANGGTLWRPRLVSAITAPDAAVVDELAPHADHRVSASPEHLAFLRDALDGAVNDPGGTGYEVRSERIRLAGKTGHELQGWRNVATWFAGYAPADDPEVAIIVLLDGSHGSAGAWVAARILEEYLARL